MPKEIHFAFHELKHLAKRKKVVGSLTFGIADVVAKAASAFTGGLSKVAIAIINGVFQGALNRHLSSDEAMEKACALYEVFLALRKNHINQHDACSRSGFTCCQDATQESIRRDYNNAVREVLGNAVEAYAEVENCINFDLPGDCWKDSAAKARHPHPHPCHLHLSQV